MNITTERKCNLGEVLGSPKYNDEYCKEKLPGGRKNWKDSPKSRKDNLKRPT